MQSFIPTAHAVSIEGLFEFFGCELVRRSTRTEHAMRRMELPPPNFTVCSPVGNELISQFALTPPHAPLPVPLNPVPQSRGNPLRTRSCTPLSGASPTPPRSTPPRLHVGQIPQDCSVPPYVVLNFQIPEGGSKSVFKAETDGPTMHLLVYFVRRRNFPVLRFLDGRAAYGHAHLGLTGGPPTPPTHSFAFALPLSAAAAPPDQPYPPPCPAADAARDCRRVHL